MRFSKTLSATVLFGTIIGTPQASLASWPGRNGRIAFGKGTNEGYVNIFTVSSHGDGKFNLSHGPHNDWGPSFSPGGEFILFYRKLEEFRYGIFRMKSDGTEVRRLIRRVGTLGAPSWSPNGKKILFWQRHGEECDWCIFKMNRDGSNVVRIEMGGKMFNPLWSPDGDRISFVRRHTQLYAAGLYTSDPDGSDEELVSAEVDWKVNWNPNGDKFVWWCHQEGEGWYLCVFNEDGSGMKSASVAGLKQDPNLTPEWSPNGRRILLSDSGKIFSVKPNGKDKTLIVRFQDSVGDLSWQPG